MHRKFTWLCVNRYLYMTYTQQQQRKKNAPKDLTKQSEKNIFISYAHYSGSYKVVLLIHSWTLHSR